LVARSGTDRVAVFLDVIVTSSTWYGTRCVKRRPPRARSCQGHLVAMAAKRAEKPGDRCDGLFLFLR
jgi:hypothetical protein